MDYGSLTIPQARAKMDEMNALYIQLRDRVNETAKRIHEFAPATRDYDLTVLSFTLDDIDQEFYRACAKCSDKEAMAGRLHTTTDQINAFGARSSSDGLPHFIRLVAIRATIVAAYAMPFSEGREGLAKGYMQRFRDTLVSHGWEVTYFGPSPTSLPEDNILAEA